MELHTLPGFRAPRLSPPIPSPWHLLADLPGISPLALPQVGIELPVTLSGWQIALSPPGKSELFPGCFSPGIRDIEIGGLPDKGHKSA